jgi:isopenicillin N synthase-like dioxygenase
MTTATDLPVIDLAPFRADPSSPDAQRTVIALRDACHHVGFAHLVGHGVDPALEAAVHTVSRRFFALPEAARLEIVNTNSPYFRGYTRLGMEHTNGRSDWRDQIDIGPERAPVSARPGDPAWLRLRGPNQWPSAVPELRGVVTAWMEAMAGVGRAVLQALALGLGQRIDHFEPAVTPDPEVLVKIIRYPAPTEGHDDGQGVGAHHDSGLLTFIHQDDVGGLEVQRGDAFVPVSRLDGAYVLNLGEMLQRATNGYLRATRHRVVSPPVGRERISVAYFFNPCMEATLSPVALPADLAALAPGGQNANPNDPVFATYGENWLKFRLRSHPDVAERHHADLLQAGATATS